MAINVFEGARRITKLIAVAGILFYIGLLFMDHPYVFTHYNIEWPGAVPTKSNCAADSVTEYRRYVLTKGGKEVSLTLCFAKQPFPDGSRIIPYQFDLDTREWIGNDSNAPEVQKYIKRTINEFVIPAADEESLDTEWWSKKWIDIRGATFVLLAGLAIFWAITWAIGWIVRGFMGIPRGHDRRSDAH